MLSFNTRKLIVPIVETIDGLETKYTASYIIEKSSRYHLQLVLRLKDETTFVSNDYIIEREPPRVFFSLNGSFLVIGNNGAEYLDVGGNGSSDSTYFIGTVYKNEDSGMLECDKTYSQLHDAFINDKKIVILHNIEDKTSTTIGGYYYLTGILYDALYFSSVVLFPDGETYRTEFFTIVYNLDGSIRVFNKTLYEDNIE